ncbi:MAG: FAD-binding oxidoreductase [Pseudomonadota bacterium]
MALIANANARLRARELTESLDALGEEGLAALPVSSDALYAFQAKVLGKVVLPNNPSYAKDRRGHNMYPDLAYPAMIVYCENHEDVRSCLQFAHENPAMPFCVRGGGHCNAGYSVCDGMVIDVSPMHFVLIEPDHTHAWVGAGATLGHVYTELDPYNLHVPGGECDTVGVAGHSMGGGYGFTSRNFGLNCDAIDAFRMMLHDGQVVYADANTNADLFWAVRGATGNTLGVLLQIRYKLAHLDDVWGFVIRWPIRESAEVLPMLQRDYVRHGVTERLGYQCAWGPDGPVVKGDHACDPSEEYFFMMGMFNGSEAEARELIAPLLDVGSAELVKHQVGRYKDLNPFLLSWYHDPPMPGTFETKQSNFIARELSPVEWNEIIDYYLTKPNRYDMCAFEVYGGVASNPSSDCAYIHRDVDFDLFIDNFMRPGWVGSDVPDGEKWLAGFNEVVARFANGHKYQNYPNRHNHNYRWNYWGDAYNSLLFVKGKYDPNNFFTFQQGLSPYPDEAGIKRSEVPSHFDDPVIVYET